MARALALPEFPGQGNDATRWLAPAFLVFLFLFLFQAHYPPQGYTPYTNAVWTSPAWRNILAATLFFGLLAGLLRPPVALRVMHWWVLGVCAAAVLYFGLVVSNRPELVEINDRSEALRIAVGKLLSGEFPYSEPTSLGGPVTPLSGSLLLALPSVLLFERPEVTSPVLLLLFVLLCGAIHKPRRASLPLFAILGVTLLNPVLLSELALGSDLFWGPLVAAASVPFLAARRLHTGAALFAVGLATRLSMAPLLPLWIVSIWRIEGRERALRFGAVCVGLLLVLHVPLVIWEPGTYCGYAPLGISAEKLALPVPQGDNVLADLLKRVLPAGGGGRTLVLSAALLALGVLMGLRARDYAHLLLLTSALLMFSLFFLGPYFLLDYLVLAVFPLSVSIMMGAEPTPPPARA